MQYNKNDKIDLDIIDMTKEGLGLAKIASQVFFVKDALLGDKVKAVITKVAKNIIYAKTIDIVEPSKFRVKEKCNVSNSCGGCQILNLDYNKQLELKKNNVINAMNKIGGFTDLSFYEGIIASDNPYHFRNKMQVPFSKRKDEIVYGFYAGRTHYIVENENCVAGFNGAKEILDAVKLALNKFDISIYDEKTNEGVFREVLIRKGNVSNEVSITYILNDKNYRKNIDLYTDFDGDVRKNQASEFKIVTSTININTNANNVLFGNTNIVLYGNGYIEDKIGDIKYHISPESFYQVNMEMTKKLYDKVVEYAGFKGNESVLDLYCGIGTISLYIAKYVKNVLGIEIVEKAIENAKENANINNIENAEFICSDVSNLDKNCSNFDTIIVDPPRKGLDSKIIHYIINIGPKKVVHVSCDPATLARDLSVFCQDEGYRLEKLVNVDMFPHTMHVETVALLEKI